MMSYNVVLSSAYPEGRRADCPNARTHHLHLLLGSKVERLVDTYRIKPVFFQCVREACFCVLGSRCDVVLIEESKRERERERETKKHSLHHGAKSKESKGAETCFLCTLSRHTRQR